MWRAFLRSPSGIFGIAIIALILAVAVAAPSLTTQALGMDVAHASQVPSWVHWFGTDRLGRDIFIRVLAATPLSIGLGGAATIVAALIGIPLGAGAALLAGRLRVVMLRFIDVMLAFSAILVALFVGAILGPGALTATLGVGIALSFSFARVVSTMALSIAGRDFIHAARLVGVGRLRVVVRHVLPNIAETMMIQTSFALSGSIVAMSSLSFLGLGVQPPQFDWGGMLTDGVQSMYVNPAAALGPAVAITVVSMGVSFLGEAMARAMNPRLWASPARLHTVAGGAPAQSPWVEPATIETNFILSVRDLTVRIGEHGPTLVDGISFSIRPGEMIGIVGESGSGKTMAAMAVACLLPPALTMTGDVTLDNGALATMSPGARRRWLGTRLAIVYQDPLSSLSPHLHLGVQMTEAARHHRNWSRAQSRATALDRLREVSLPNPALQLRRYPHELSGGMRQRAMIAMGLMVEPGLLIADEPTTALDVTIQAQIMELLGKINRARGMAILLISHNIGLVAQNCDRVLVMYAGRIVEQGSTAAVTSAPAHPYTRALMGAVPDLLLDNNETLSDIPGAMPEPSQRGAGCQFAPRCPLAFARCRIETPPLIADQAGHETACWAAHP